MADEHNTLRSLLGKTVVAIENRGNELEFRRDDGWTVTMHHEQDCCEEVTLEEVCGDLNDLIGSPIVEATESKSTQEDDTWDRSRTWTFYRLSTARGTVTLRWLGESSGYYSEEVDITVRDASGKKVWSDGA